jgi:hypothetical protein
MSPHALVPFARAFRSYHGSRRARSLATMLRLIDARAGSCVEVRPARRGLLRVHADVPAGADACDVTGLRVLLTADLLVRTAELGELQALATWAFGARAPEQAAALECAADALGIHPPAVRAGSGGTTAAPADVRLTGQAAAEDAEDGGQGGIVVRVGAARMPGGTEQVAGHDPLAVRLALLSSGYHQAAGLTEEVLARARDTLRRWRRLVAQWAESPSRPVPAPVAAAARDAFGSLDTVAALELLRGLAADDGVPAGARFEAFVYADRVLGLDLPRDIGRLAG